MESKKDRKQVARCRYHSDRIKDIDAGKYNYFPEWYRERIREQSVLHLVEKPQLNSKKGIHEMKKYEQLAKEMQPINVTGLLPDRVIHDSVIRFIEKRMADIAYHRGGTDRRRSQRECFMWR